MLCSTIQYESSIIFIIIIALRGVDLITLYYNIFVSCT